MDSSFGVLDAFAFLVFAVLIAVAVIVIVKLGSRSSPPVYNWRGNYVASMAAGVAGALLSMHVRNCKREGTVLGRSHFLRRPAQGR
jgi:hypothetical protein